MKIGTISFLLIMIVSQAAGASAIDEALLKIFSTPTGQRALCPFADTREHLALYIGPSNSTATQIQSICGTRQFSQVARANLISMSARLSASEQPFAPQKQYVLMGRQSEYPGIESYTSKANVTYFMMNDSEIRGAGLLRALAHELAMSYDQLSRLGYLVDPSWEQGLNAAFGRPLYTLTSVFEPLPNVQEIKCALRDPAIRYALATERAFRFEDLIIDELGLTRQSPPVASGSFQSAIARYSRLYEQFSQLVAWEAVKYQVMCGKPAASRRGREQEIARREQLLQSTVLRFQSTQQTKLMPDLLVEPHVGPFLHDLDGGGPRPRVGGWGGGE